MGVYIYVWQQLHGGRRCGLVLRVGGVSGGGRAPKPLLNVASYSRVWPSMNTVERDGHARSRSCAMTQARWLRCSICLPDGGALEVALKAWHSDRSQRTTWDLVSILDAVYPKPPKICKSIANLLPTWRIDWVALGVDWMEEFVPSLAAYKRMIGLPDGEKQRHCAYNASVGLLRETPQLGTMGALSVLADIAATSKGAPETPSASDAEGHRRPSLSEPRCAGTPI